MEMEQLMARLLAEIRTNQAKADASLREMRAEMLAKMETKQERLDARIEANNEKFEVLEGTFVSRMDADHGKTEVNHEELKAAVKASHERIEALMNVSLEKMKELASVEMKSVVVHEEVPKEDAAAKTGGALNKQHGDRNLAVGRCKKAKGTDPGPWWFRKKLAATYRGMTRHAGVAWRKGHSRENVAPRTQKR
jgi:hypothetical protein